MGLMLNLGSGLSPLPGYVNVDKHGSPDVVHDLEAFPWPWGDSTVSRVMASHSLEHMGREPDVFIGIMRELYRVCEHGARVLIKVPHWRHDDFSNDPTHVRVINGEVMSLFSRRQCEGWARGGFANTPLALYHGVDFETVKNHLVIEEPYIAEYAAGRLSQEQVMELARQRNNVIREIELELRVVKE